MSEKVKLDIRSLVGEKLYQERFADKEMEKEIGDKRSSSSTNQTETKKVKSDQVIRCCDPIQSSSDQDETLKTNNCKDCGGIMVRKKSRNINKMSKLYVCSICSKELSNRHSLSRHKKKYCKGLVNQPVINQRQPRIFQKSRMCEKCGKTLSNYQALWRHKKTCKFTNTHTKTDTDIYTWRKPTAQVENRNATISSIHLKWNGKCWESINRDIHYRLNLGRDLVSLLERGAIKEDVLNCTQREYVNMYKKLFIE